MQHQSFHAYTNTPRTLPSSDAHTHTAADITYVLCSKETPRQQSRTREAGGGECPRRTQPCVQRACMRTTRHTRRTRPHHTATAHAQVTGKQQRSRTTKKIDLWVYAFISERGQCMQIRTKGQDWTNNKMYTNPHLSHTHTHNWNTNTKTKNNLHKSNFLFIICQHLNMHTQKHINIQTNKQTTTQ